MKKIENISGRKIPGVFGAPKPWALVTFFNRRVTKNLKSNKILVSRGR
jgi:hypothetical protein